MSATVTKGKRRHPPEPEAVNMGFQIAPMIDVVFVIMLFFMAMAGAVKVERELKQTLPGSVTQSSDAPDVPDEILVGVEESGSVTLNEEELDPQASKTMPNFTATMMRLKQEADTRKAKVLVTIKAEEQAKYERVIDVLNAMARAQVSNVTFTVGGDE
ncbi:MAG: biopolymer transporter ExbD [Verrucomicrobiaceae bacterium]|nr:biopolymer transporter ExbD [Verrucomicrobiaceae bacterium]